MLLDLHLTTYHSNIDTHVSIDVLELGTCTLRESCHAMNCKYIDYSQLESRM